MFNTHKNHAYTRDAFHRVAKNGINVESGTPLKKDGEFLSIAGPGEEIYGISATVKQFAPDNETNRKEIVLYYPVNEDDTYKIEISSGVTYASMVGKTADIDALCNIDTGTIGSGKQVEVISILGPKYLEVSILKGIVEIPPVPTIVEPVVMDDTNVATFTVSNPLQTNFYINADTSTGTITIPNASMGMAVGSLLTIRKITTDSNIIEYNDGSVNYQFIKKQGELITLERNGSQFLVR